ncbi:MAG: RNA methyltransferase substrate-binding domain-containing protein, partial [Chloroflexota bacterium]
MKEWITGRNPVYELLKAGRRHFFRLWISKGLKIEGRLHQIIQLTRERQIMTEQVPRNNLDNIYANHQGIAMETSAYPYAAFSDILQHSKAQNEAPFFLILDLIQD